MSCAGALVSLVDEDKLQDIVVAIESAIVLSFGQDKARITASETKRRTEICIDLVKTLRGDLKWSVPRIIDYLPTYLRCELDGIAYAPSTAAIWSPDDLARLSLV